MILLCFSEHENVIPYAVDFEDVRVSGTMFLAKNCIGYCIEPANTLPMNHFRLTTRYFTSYLQSLATPSLPKQQRQQRTNPYSWRSPTPARLKTAGTKSRPFNKTPAPHPRLASSLLFPSDPSVSKQKRASTVGPSYTHPSTHPPTRRKCHSYMTQT
ncbi:hypothetical protein K432DRAFT_381486 [Lepidopterella palustris CBS 459.81]|uniref:Uncharacterized protein n=1 Tax=Lepidopterella palustris CBS 459.81 TaxID=1314670 RepID=A0A8E2EC04_9PEZI|nr:hypothetical protein K432DRAFT_381486 [Lepidopterella palustris CBS 459.81]